MVICLELHPYRGITGDPDVQHIRRFDVEHDPFQAAAEVGGLDDRGIRERHLGEVSLNTPADGDPSSDVRAHADIRWRRGWRRWRRSRFVVLRQRRVRRRGRNPGGDGVGDVAARVHRDVPSADGAAHIGRSFLGLRQGGQAQGQQGQPAGRHHSNGPHDRDRTAVWARNRVKLTAGAQDRPTSARRGSASLCSILTADLFSARSADAGHTRGGRHGQHPAR